MVDIDELASFCKRKGFVFPSSEIYGGVAGFWDYGPLGVELRNNIKQTWWKYYVRDRPDIVGVDTSIITHPKVWVASGHVASFNDILVECKKCHERFRADHLIEDALKVKTEGLKVDDLNKLIVDNNVKCLKCKGSLTDSAPFNIMFVTYIGPKKDTECLAYLRAETCQAIFADFKLVQETSRLKLPFGIAQIGRVFRNEIAPRNFIFRDRELEQMEIEYFVHPDKVENCPLLTNEILNHEILTYSAEMQQKNQKPKIIKLEDAIDKKMIRNSWHAYWIFVSHTWFISLGAKPDKFRIRQHLPDEKSHYSSDTWDLEYEFPHGWKELQGFANRTDYDLTQHMKVSGKDLTLYDEETKKRITPHVVCEPSLGVERTMMVFLFDAYEYDKKRENVVLHLSPKLAPVTCGIFPLLSNKEELVKKAKEVYEELRTCYPCQYDESGSIGKRYARMDEMGTPFCVTVDFDSLKDNTVTVRDRDSTKQQRVKISELRQFLYEAIFSSNKFA